MHVVPEFEECWWDSLFLDTLGANVLGMVIGTKINQWILSRRRTGGETGSEGGSLNDDDTSNQTELGSRFDWMGRDWKCFSSLKRMVQVSTAAFFMSLSELNTFLLINAFGIADNTSWCVLLRILFVALIAIPAVAEWYVYIEECDQYGENVVVRLGPSLWLLFWTTLLEIAVAVRFFPDHMRVGIERAGNVTGLPYDVLIPLLSSIVIVFVWVVLKYGLIQSWSGTALVKRKPTLQSLDFLLAIACLPIAHLFQKGWKWD